MEMGYPLRVVSNVCNPDEQLFNASYGALLGVMGSMWNSSLIRPDAYLAILAMNSDNEDDNSRTNSVDWFAGQYASLKGADRPDLFSWSYVTPSQLGSKRGRVPFSRLAQRVSSMLDLVGGVALDTTQSDWTDGLLDLWALALSSSNRFPLSAKPDPSSIAVYLDGPPPGQAAPGQMVGVQVIATRPNGDVNWSYDPTANVINVNYGALSLSSSDTLYVEYTVVCD